jgi:cullin 3
LLILRLKEIKDASTIDDTELKRQLQSLACAKFKILKKHPPGREVYPDDSFSFNNDFSSAMQKIKISTISSRVESKDERKETRDRIDEERKHQMEVFFCFLLFSALRFLICSLIGLHRPNYEGQETYEP